MQYKMTIFPINSSHFIFPIGPIFWGGFGFLIHHENVSI